jgi:hypothetical protein
MLRLAADMSDRRLADWSHWYHGPGAPASDAPWFELAAGSPARAVQTAIRGGVIASRAVDRSTVSFEVGRT